jgi:hypothetical protein
MKSSARLPIEDDDYSDCQQHIKEMAGKGGEMSVICFIVGVLTGVVLMACLYGGGAVEHTKGRTS